MQLGRKDPMSHQSGALGTGSRAGGSGGNSVWRRLDFKFQYSNMSAARARDWKIAPVVWRSGRFGHAARAGTILGVTDRVRGTVACGSGTQLQQCFVQIGSKSKGAVRTRALMDTREGSGLGQTGSPVAPRMKQGTGAGSGVTPSRCCARKEKQPRLQPAGQGRSRAEPGMKQTLVSRPWSGKELRNKTDSSEKEDLSVARGYRQGTASRSIRSRKECF